MDIYTDRIQITPYDKKNTDEVNAYIAAHPDTILRLYWFEQPGDFSFLHKIRNVRKLSISYCQLTDLAFLDYFPDLQYLDISEVKGKADLAVLKNQTSLKTLFLALQGLTNQNNLSVLHGLKELKEFHFAGKFKKKSLSLANFEQLVTLAPQIKDIDMEEAQQLTALKIFCLNNQKVSSLEGIEHLQSLQTVKLNAIRIEDQNILADIFRLKRLENLSISYVKAITDFRFIPPGSHLKNLALWSLNGLESLQGLEKLTALEYYSQCGEHTYRNTIDFSILQQLKTVKEIEVKVGIMNTEAKSKLDAIIQSIQSC